MSLLSFDLIKAPASATVDVNIPTFAKTYFSTSNGNLKKIDFNEIPMSSIELYL